MAKTEEIKKKPFFLGKYFLYFLLAYALLFIIFLSFNSKMSVLSKNIFLGLIFLFFVILMVILVFSYLRKETFAYSIKPIVSEDERVLYSEKNVWVHRMNILAGKFILTRMDIYLTPKRMILTPRSISEVGRGAGLQKNICWGGFSTKIRNIAYLWTESILTRYFVNSPDSLSIGESAFREEQFREGKYIKIRTFFLHVVPITFTIYSKQAEKIRKLINKELMNQEG